jgi:predicted transcriptional regulator
MEDLRISVRLDKDTRRRLDEEARATGKHESEVVREALAAYFQQRPRPESCLELAQRAGLLGCAKGLPADLSTNPEYMEGFGR